MDSNQLVTVVWGPGKVTYLKKADIRTIIAALTPNQQPVHVRDGLLAILEEIVKA